MSAAPRALGPRLARVVRAIQLPGGGARAIERPTLLYAAYALVAFVVSLVFTFPIDGLLRSVVTRQVAPPATVEFARARLGVPVAVTIDELRLLDGAAESSELLAVDSVRLAPSLLGLLGGHGYPLGLRAALYGGDVVATVDPRPDAFDLDATFTAVDLGRATGLGRIADGTVRGVLDGRAQLSGSLEVPTTLNGQAVIDGRAIALEAVHVGGVRVPDLHFRTLELRADVTDGRVVIRTLTADGEELRVTGGGTALLRRPLESSLLNVDLSVAPAPSAPDGLRIALNLLPGTPGADGGRTIQLTGSAGQLQVR